MCLLDFFQEVGKVVEIVYTFLEIVVGRFEWEKWSDHQKKT